VNGGSGHRKGRQDLSVTRVTAGKRAKGECNCEHVVLGRELRAPNVVPVTAFNLGSYPNPDLRLGVWNGQPKTAYFRQRATQAGRAASKEEGTPARMRAGVSPSALDRMTTARRSISER
jgi:hypothetical protein